MTQQQVTRQSEFEIAHDSPACEDPERCPICTPGCLDATMGFQKIVSAMVYCIEYDHPPAARDVLRPLGDAIIKENQSIDVNEAFDWSQRKWRSLRKVGHGKAVMEYLDGISEATK